MVTIDQIKKLRDETQLPLSDIRTALEETDGNETAAKKILLEKSRERAEEKKSREAGDGVVFTYVHQGGKTGVMLDLRCETDFVARTEVFQNLGKELCLQIASMGPEKTEELLEQDYIREPGKKIADLIGEASGTLGEHVKIEKFVRYSI
ncbi:MAG: elongation factor Ts [Patescibacteria group bacterium]